MEVTLATVTGLLLNKRFSISNLDLYKGPEPVQWISFMTNLNTIQLLFNLEIIKAPNEALFKFDMSIFYKPFMATLNQTLAVTGKCPIVFS